MQITRKIFYLWILLGGVALAQIEIIQPVDSVVKPPAGLTDQTEKFAASRWSEVDSGLEAAGVDTQDKKVLHVWTNLRKRDYGKAASLAATYKAGAFLNNRKPFVDTEEFITLKQSLAGKNYSAKRAAISAWKASKPTNQFMHEADYLDIEAICVQGDDPTTAADNFIAKYPEHPCCETLKDAKAIRKLDLERLNARRIQFKTSPVPEEPTSAEYQLGISLCALKATRMNPSTTTAVLQSELIDECSAMVSALSNDAERFWAIWLYMVDEDWTNFETVSEDWLTSYPTIRPTARDLEVRLWLGDRYSRTARYTEAEDMAKDIIDLNWKTSQMYELGGAQEGTCKGWARSILRQVRQHRGY